MSDTRWLKIERIFNDAVLLPTDEKRIFIAEKCGEDFELRREINDMLAEDANENNPLERPIFSYGVQLISNDFEFEDVISQAEFASYKLRRVLGRGGMGGVLLAEDKRLGRLVALKILPANLAPNDEVAIRFQQEARAISAISHPNVTHIYEIGIFGGRHFMAMEYVTGTTLRQIMKQEKFDGRAIAEIALQIAKALATAHNVGVIHRDIKPENVMISKDRHVKVLDFGLAKFIEPLDTENEEYLQIYSSGRTSLDTQPGTIFGTTAYMSPEQVRGKPLSACTDIWSFGVVLYEMLAGKRPFTGETPSDIRAAILLAEPPLLSEMPVMPELARIAHQCLQKNDDQRCVTAEELVAELRLVLRQIYIHDSDDNGNFAATPHSVLKPDTGESEKSRRKRQKSFSDHSILFGIVLLLITLLTVFLLSK